MSNGEGMFHIKWSDDIEKRQEDLDALVFTGCEESPGSLNEIFQNVDYKFQILTNWGQGVNPWARCRDYLHDIFRTAICGDETDVYGMYYTSDMNEDTPVALDMMLMAALNIPNDDAASCALRLLNYYDKMAGFQPTVMSKKEDGVYIFMGDKGWTSAPAIISFFTFLIRLGSYWDKVEDNLLGSFDNADELKVAYDKLIVGGYNCQNDISYLKRIIDTLDYVITNHDDIFESDWTNAPGIGQHRFHDQSGIVSICEPDESFDPDSDDAYAYEYDDCDCYFNQDAYMKVHHN